jgi:hypothetical protein
MKTVARDSAGRQTDFPERRYGARSQLEAPRARTPRGWPGTARVSRKEEEKMSLRGVLIERPEDPSRQRGGQKRWKQLRPKP